MSDFSLMQDTMQVSIWELGTIYKPMHIGNNLSTYIGDHVGTRIGFHGIFEEGSGEYQCRFL